MSDQHSGAHSAPSGLTNGSFDKR